MAQIKEVLEKHLENVIKGNIDAALADLTEEVKAGIQPILETLGKVQPTKYEILGIEEKDEEAVTREKYIGKTEELSVEATWKKIEGVWKVVSVKPL